MFRTLFLILTLLPCQNLKSQISNHKSPNFLLILADDQGWNALSTRMHPDLPGSGSTYYRTPNLDQLAAAGMRFSQAYSPAPTCSPTRHALQFGRSPASLKIFGADRISNWDAPNSESLPHILKQINPDYVCAHIGKWHIGKSPDALGYDHHDGPNGNGTGNSKNPADPKRIFEVSEKSRAFIAQQVKAQKPFFLQISHYANHLKYQAKPETINKYETQHADDATDYQNSSLWAAMNEDLDTGIGIVLDELKKQNILDNTYIFYTADNGYESKRDFKKTVDQRGYYKAFPQRSHKYNVSEGGIRVPFIFTGPGIPANSHSTTPVVGTDIFPTIMHLSGGSKNIPKNVEGANLAPHATSGTQKPIQRNDPFLVFKHSKPRPPQDITLIEGPWKLIKDLDTGKTFLFNLDQDIGEKQNLKETHPERTTRMYQQMTTYFARFGWNESMIIKPK